MLSPLSRNEPRTRPSPPTSKARPDFDVQHRENNLRHDREALAAERQQLAQERRQLERDRQIFEEQVEERDQQRDREISERHTAAATQRAEVMAGDLAHDIDRDRPNHTATLILNAARKARGELPEEPISEMAASILRAGAVARGEASAGGDTLTNPTARAVIISGRRARGEDLSEADEAFLNSYLEKMRK